METTSGPTSSEPSNSPRRALLAAAAWSVLAALQVAAAFGLAGSEDARRDELIYEYEFALGVPLVYGLLVALTFVVATAFGNPLPALGIRAFRLRWMWIAFGVILIALAIQVVFQLLFQVDAGEEQGALPETWRPDRLGALALNTFVIVTLVPLAEELFYRGLGVRALAVFGAPVAIVGTALVFGLAHGILSALPGLVAFAAGLAWVRLRSDSVWPGVFAHGLYNGLVIALALAATSL
jgi:membrane protease YdiL (CAAX protease family)